MSNYHDSVASSHDEITEDEARVQIAKFFKDFAENAIKQSFKCVSSKLHYRNIIERLRIGEDLAAELPQLREMSVEDVEKILQELISKCSVELESYWVIQNKKVITELSMQNYNGEHIERFKAKYKFNTKSGEVVINVETKGENASVGIKNESGKKEKKIQALKSVINQIDLMRLQ